MRSDSSDADGSQSTARTDTRVTRVGRIIRRTSIDELPQIANQEGIKMAMLSVPAEAAQPVADRLAEAGITGILNFAPVTLSLPAGVDAEGVDLAIELEQLSFAVINRRLAASP